MSSINKTLRGYVVDDITLSQSDVDALLEKGPFAVLLVIDARFRRDNGDGANPKMVIGPPLVTSVAIQTPEAPVETKTSAPKGKGKE